MAAAPSNYPPHSAGIGKSVKAGKADRPWPVRGAPWNLQPVGEDCEHCYVAHAALQSGMTKTVTLRDANQSFARCIRDVEAGEEYIITRNGTPVARLSPVKPQRTLTAEQRAALERTLHRMQAGWDLGAGPLDRDALHER